MNLIKALKEKLSGFWSRKGRRAKKVTVVLAIDGKEFSRVIYQGRGIG